ncbi:DeoR/GlpR family DNA-binding transcription regulator [Roseobacter sp. HKCCA0434]|uniref:DeoR/GlpR family DNA-binding transcription regulator n=1 Tax=Roseobacter sp. HKCCA0434 TaxID=3079297 RepID=UPI002905D6D0|nr:DeoR/GlpR family DNA-binding transcription regulator [Roseobacter sp. HKCCA0434]
MDQTQRQNEILSQIERRGRVSVSDLARTHATSQQTIRKDLRSLERAGRLARIHGGAVRADPARYADYGARRQIAAAAKSAIGAMCASLIPDNSTVFVNIGTTTEAAATRLTRHSGLRLLIDNINVANELRAYPGLEILIAGGRVRAGDGAIVGEQAVQFIQQFRVDYALIGAAAIEPDGALMDHDLREAQVAAAIMQSARHVILTADASKFGRTAPVRIGALSQVHTLITDRDVPPRIASLCAEAGTRILTTRGGQEA